MRGPNFTKLGEDIRPSSALTEFVSELRYHAPFSNAWASKLSDVKNKAIYFALLTPVKIRRGVGEIPELRFEASPRTEPRV